MEVSPQLFSIIRNLNGNELWELSKVEIVAEAELFGWSLQLEVARTMEDNISMLRCQLKEAVDIVLVGIELDAMF